MSILPLLMNELSGLDYYRRPHLRDLYGQNFGLGLLDDDLLQTRPYLRPWRNLSRSNSGVSSIHVDKNEFKVNLDVQQFKPEELNVKVVEGFVIVEGKHEERSDEHGLVSRQFTRRYKLPEDAQITSLSSSLSSDGVLTITAPKKAQSTEQGRSIPIVQTNAPAIKPEPPKENTEAPKEAKTEEKKE